MIILCGFLTTVDSFYITQPFEPQIMNKILIRAAFKLSLAFILFQRNYFKMIVMRTEFWELFVLPGKVSLFNIFLSVNAPSVWLRGIEKTLLSEGT